MASFTWEAHAVFFVWLASQFFLYWAVPGPTVDGPPLRDGKRLKYKLNGEAENAFLTTGGWREVPPSPAHQCPAH